MGRSWIVSIVLFLSMVASAADVKPKELCDQFKQQICAVHEGTECVMRFLKNAGLTDQKVRVPVAKTAGAWLGAAAFKNLLVENPKMASDPSQIPEASVVVLMKTAGSACAVPEKDGNVGLKCGADDLVWDVETGKVKTQSLSAVLKSDPKCLQAVMQSPKFFAKKNKTDK